MYPGYGWDKKSTGRLIELYGLIRQAQLNSYGSPTFQREAKQRGTEPDACYCFGRMMSDDGHPDVVLEVIHAKPLLDKLDVYVGFGIPEVWLFRKGAFELYRLTAERDQYERIERSRFLPDLDFAMIARLAVIRDQQDALDELIKLIR